MKGGKAKGKQSNAPAGPPPVTQKDLFHRYNYTLQSSIYLQQLLDTPAAGPSSRPAQPSPTGPSLRKGNGKVSVESRDAGPSISQVARNNMRASRGMAVHNLLKLDPALKRTVCRTCSTVLVPGLTSRLRNKHDKNHGHRTRQTCLTCSTSRSIPAPPIMSDHVSDKLDGPVRARRRERLARKAKIAFHELERTTDSEGHSLWSATEPVLGWGVTGRPAIQQPQRDEGMAIVNALAKPPAPPRPPVKVPQSKPDQSTVPSGELDEEAMMNG